MKISLIFLLIGVFACAVALEEEPGDEIELTKEEEDSVVNEYIDRFNIRFGRSMNSNVTRENILKNHKINEKHNRNENRTFDMGLNEFSSMTIEEFAATRLGFNPPEDFNVDNDTLVPVVDKTVRQARSAIPTYWNWAEQGSVVQPVQNQGSCGSCYAFAAIGAIEGSRCRYYGQCTKLSEQEAMECTNSCNGGWDDWVYTYTKNKEGATTSSYSYTPYLRYGCEYASTRARATKTKVDNFKVLPNDAETIRTFLYQYGPLFVSYYVYQNFYQYTGGIYTYASGNYLGAHAVLLVGYGIENGIPYWILKNSWGSGWGERGYFRMKRGIDLCRIESWKVSFPFT